MLSRIHQKLGTAGFIISIVALVAALGGGAYAASGGLTGKQKKEVEKIAKKYAGKPGANGASGAKGDTGAAGSNGTNGIAGTNGSPGSPGAPGKSIEVAQIAPGLGEGCEGRGGIEVEVAGSTEPSEVCNGQPWNPAGLAKGATETGTWTVNANPELADEAGKIYVPISFTVPLSHEIEFGKGKVHFVPFGGEGVCGGEAPEPTAPEGELCIYVTEQEGVHFLRTLSLENATNAASKAGTVMVFNEIQEHAFAYGSWAVTGG